MEIEAVNFDIKGDHRGQLVAFEENHNVPFNIKRVYYIYGTIDNVTRGLHAHYKTRQLAICINGSCDMLFDDGKSKTTVTLDTPAKGYVIEPMIWHEMSNFSADCILLVLADDYYDESDYVRNYDKFLELI